MASFMVRAPIPVITALDAAVTTLASRLANTLPTSLTQSEHAPTTDDLRIHAIALLATGHPAHATRAAAAAQTANTGTGTTPHPETGTEPEPAAGTAPDPGLDPTAGAQPDPTTGAQPDTAARTSPDTGRHDPVDPNHGQDHGQGLDLSLDLGFDLAEVDLRDLLPRTSIVVHLYGGTLHTGQDGTSGTTSPGTSSSVTVPAGRDLDADGNPLDRTARIEGHGAVTETWLRDVLGRYAHFDIHPVLDIDGLAPVDAYEIPTRHRRAVQLRHPVETFPWGSATTTSSHVQLDHEQPWQPPRSPEPGQPPAADQPPPQAPGTERAPGQTRVDNLGPLHTFHHRLKTHGGWDVHEPAPGVHLWRDPHGGLYLRDATGTRRLDWTLPHDSTGEHPGRTEGALGASVIEIYPQQRPLVLAGDLARQRWSHPAA
jgi:hypothetical protein